MFSLHCTTCDATYLMGVAAIAAAISTGGTIATGAGTVAAVLCPHGHVNTTGFDARIEAGRGRSRDAERVGALQVEAGAILRT